MPMTTLIKPKTLSTEAIEALEHVYHGPTWACDEDGYWMLPERTLGWQVLYWMHHYLHSPDGTGAPFVPTDEQKRFILHWFALDSNGRFSARTGVLQRLKGWG